MVTASLAAGFPVNTRDEAGATAMHHAAIHGHAAITRELLSRGADVTIRDREHSATPLGWACFGADFVKESSGDYEATVQVLLDAVAQPSPEARPPEHAGVRQMLQRHARRPEAGHRENP